MSEPSEPGFDVFLSHNSKDKPSVRRLKKRLVERNLRVWFDEDELQPGISWQRLLEAGVRASKSVAVLVGKDGLGPWETEEMEAALHLAVKDGRPVIPVLLPGAPHEPDLPLFLGTRTWVNLRPQLTTKKLDSLVWGITGQKPPAVPSRNAPGAAKPCGRHGAKNLLISPTRLRHTAPHLFGRTAELEALDQAWENDRTHIISFAAWGGVGKTSLVAEWMGRLAADGWRGAERVFDWSFYSQGTRREGEGSKQASADVFVAEALQFFGDPEPQKGSPWDRGSRLASLVGRTRTLLVLDGLEPLQHPPGPQAGSLTDPALGALLKGLAGQNQGLCVLTTREVVTDLAAFTGKTVLDCRLDRLSDEDGAALLRSFGVVGPDRELETASREVVGHALTLQLMGRYLALAHQGDIRRRDLFGFTEADAEVQGGHAFRVLAAYERWLVSEDVVPSVHGSAPRSGGKAMLAILRIMGFFDRPADPGCLAALRNEPAIEGLTEPLVELSEAQWNIAVKRLEELGLLSRVPFEPATIRGYDEPTARARLEGKAPYGDLPEPQSFTRAGVMRGESLDAHPLLREYFGERIRTQCLAAFQAGHKRLFEHLSGSVPYWPEGIEGLQPLYQAVPHACLAGLHQQACYEVYEDRIVRGTSYFSTFRLGLIGADLGALASFFVRPWSNPVAGFSSAEAGWLLNEVAYRLEGLGRLSEAEEPMLAGIKSAIEGGEWRNAAQAAENLNGLELTRGEIAKAVAVGQQGVTFAERSGNSFRRISSRATLAEALHQAGRRTEARQLFEEAESQQARYSPAYSLLYSLRGFHYCDLLLSDMERAAWQCCLKGEAGFGKTPSKARTACDVIIERASQTLEWSTPKGWRFEIALDHLTLARADFYKSYSNSVVSEFTWIHIDRAIDHLYGASTLQYLPLGFLTRSWFRYVSGEEAGCQADLDEAWEIAERGPMPLHQADIQLYRARLFRDRAALAEARRLIEKHGYHRRDEELADAEEAAKGW